MTYYMAFVSIFYLDSNTVRAAIVEMRPTEASKGPNKDKWQTTL